MTPPLFGGMLLATATVGATASLTTAFPMPPVQTATQARVTAAKAADAAIASTAATPKVLAFLDSADVRALLRECCPEAANRRSQSLLEQWRAEVRSAEVAHTFPINASMTSDMNLELLESRKYGWWLNPWQAQLVSKAADQPPIAVAPWGANGPRVGNGTSGIGDAEVRMGFSIEVP